MLALAALVFDVWVGAKEEWERERDKRGEGERECWREREWGITWYYTCQILCIIIRDVDWWPNNEGGISDRGLRRKRENNHYPRFPSLRWVGDLFLANLPFFIENDPASSVTLGLAKATNEICFTCVPLFCLRTSKRPVNARVFPPPHKKPPFLIDDFLFPLSLSR